VNILVGITSYGTGHARYLDRVLDEYGSWNLDHTVLVFTEAWRDLQGRATQVVKESTADPLGLTWAHRERFAQQAKDYDYFLYAEDDILVRERTVLAWIRANEILGNNTEVPALFVRETGFNGYVNYPQAHHPFEWVGEVAEIGGHRFRPFSNVHPACCLLSRRQLELAIISGRYVAEPHASGRYAVRELACSGVFVECGLNSLVDLTLFDELTVEHLPANYIGVLGTSGERMKKQVAEMLK
jgi:hypothetical protein